MMKNLGFPVVVGLTRLWTRLYTAGMPREVRDRRRAEIESDIWESTEPVDRLSGSHVLRLLIGVPDDVLWRYSHQPTGSVVRLLLTGLATGIVVATLMFLFGLGRTARLPTPEPAFRGVGALPAPPPPPPPPCAPPGLERKSPSPCTP
jgi:hypothetical protein